MHGYEARYRLIWGTSGARPLGGARPVIARAESGNTARALAPHSQNTSLLRGVALARGVLCRLIAGCLR